MAASTMAQMMRASSAVGRHGVAALAGEFHAADRHEADVGARAVGAEHVAREVVVARARATAFVPPAEAALTPGSHLR